MSQPIPSPSPNDGSMTPALGVVRASSERRVGRVNRSRVAWHHSPVARGLGEGRGGVYRTAELPGSKKGEGDIRPLNDRLLPNRSHCLCLRQPNVVTGRGAMTLNLKSCSAAVRCAKMVRRCFMQTAPGRSPNSLRPQSLQRTPQPGLGPAGPCAIRPDNPHEATRGEGGWRSPSHEVPREPRRRGPGH